MVLYDKDLCHERVKGHNKVKTSSLSEVTFASYFDD